MRAALLESVGAPLTLAEVEQPSPAPGEVLLKVRGCGICGSDLHIAQTFVPPGAIMGHEFCGEIAALGEGVVESESLTAGRLVSGFPVFGCGSCPACRSGRSPKCTGAAAKGLLGLDRPGAFAEYVTLSAEHALALPSEIDAPLAAMIEPLAVAHHALERTPRAPGSPLLVLGGGPVGAAVALWGLHTGASQVVVSDPVPHRRALVEGFGALAVDPSSVNVRSAFVDLTGAAPRTVIECVGIPGLIQEATNIADTDGVVTVVGMCMQMDQIFPPVPMTKELSLHFVTYYTEDDFQTTAQAIAAGSLDPRPLVTDVIDLDSLPESFEALKRPSTQCKVIVEP